MYATVLFVNVERAILVYEEAEKQIPKVCFIEVV